MPWPADHCRGLAFHCSIVCPMPLTQIHCQLEWKQLCRTELTTYIYLAVSGAICPTVYYLDKFFCMS